MAEKRGAPTTTADELPVAPIDLSHLLISNDPLDAQIPFIQQIITLTQLRVDALNARIDALTSSAIMDQLLLECDKAAELVVQCSGVLSPIRRVPPELICEIFSWTSPCTRNIGKNTVAHPPWHLGHICRSWRDTALVYPPLWNSINILHSTRYPHENSFPLSMIETQLIRSANAPLLLDFDWRGQSDNTPLLTSLVLHCERWTSIRFSKHPSNLFHLLRPVQGRLPQLQSLELVDTVTYMPTVEESDLPDIFSSAPNLREVCLTGPGFNEYSPDLTIPWTQITRYRGAYDSIGDQLDILESASNLIECGITCDDQETDDARIITLPHLRRLYVEKLFFAEPSHRTTPRKPSRSAQWTCYFLSSTALLAR
ncbi:hypothetical protein C8R44DRAFT_985125 [Mycena epipterygia]|nr:hypothetical protein C8R44DRAFT_985125 [Mycena epipterygia]